jgi:GH43 family beta-xylosidase
MSHSSKEISGSSRLLSSTSRRAFVCGLGAAGALPLTASLLAQPAKTAKTYKNPLNCNIGDPFVLKAPDGQYYIYGTGGGGFMGGPPPAGFGGHPPAGAGGPAAAVAGGPPPGVVRDPSTAFPTFTSPNLVDWTEVGQTYKRDPETSWCVGAFWAPEVYYVKGRYYMFYSAQWRNNPTKEQENFRIGVAVAEKPTGPFKDIRNEPLFDPGYPAIDADVLFDDNGRVYLYYSRCCYKHPVESEIADWAKKEGWYTEIEESWVYGIELKPDFSGVIGEPVQLLRPPVSFAQWTEGWENRAVLSHAVNRRWTEGPNSLKHGGKYYIMYSANSVAGPDYALGYATADQPLGPFTKALNNPVAEKNTMRGGNVITTAHNCVATSPDGKEMYCLYGARTTDMKSRGRILFLCKMEIRPDGILLIEPPDTDIVHPYPSGS